MSEQFVREALTTHNVYRARHGAPALKLSKELCKSAQEWADKLLSMSNLQNSPLSNNGAVGENIACRTSSKMADLSGKEVSDQWYKEVAKYDFASGKGTGDSGNFTQLVWQTTSEAGFGKARSADGRRCIVVGHYSPSGNVIGLYVNNVRPTLASAPHTSVTAKAGDVEATPKPQEGATSAQFVSEALATHNAHRARHGAPALKLSASLCKSAQEWAEKLLDLPDLENSPLAQKDVVGENTSMQSGSNIIVDISGKDVSDEWYNEIAQYDFASDSGSDETGSFSQLVWKGTSEVGFGKAISADGHRCFVVGHYTPPGNVTGQYQSNVRPAQN